MEFFTSAIDTLKVLVIALGAGLGVWGVINLLEGYGNDNPGAKSQGMKQLMAGGGVTRDLVLANVVLNELDHWIDSQWTEHPVANRYGTWRTIRTSEVFDKEQGLPENAEQQSQGNVHCALCG